MSIDNFSSSNNNEFVPPDLHFPPSSIPLKPIETRYLLIRALGHGSFGTVTLAKAQFDLNCLSREVGSRLTLMYQDKSLPQNKMTKNQKLVAIKTMVTRLKTLHDYKKVRELKFILRMAPSPYLIQIFEVFIDNNNFQLHIVMEYMEQNLYQIMKHRRHKVFSYPSLKSILAQILGAIKHIHSYDFYHRDIKPENILVTPTSMYYENSDDYPESYVIKLADFGLAREVHNRKTYTPYVSTRWYRSPEILLRNGYYSTPLDIWAFGCVAFEMITFKPLFPGTNELDQVWKILEVLGTPYKSPEFVNFNSSPFGGFWKDSLLLLNKLNLKLPFSEGIDIFTMVSNPRLKDLADVIGKCLKWDPHERPNAVELSKFKYFQNTVAQKDVCTNSNQFSNMQQAMLFAGINPTPFNVVNKNLRIEGKKDNVYSKDMIQNPLKKLHFEDLKGKLNLNLQSQQVEVTNDDILQNPLEEKLTVKEFLNEYQWETAEKNNNTFTQGKAPTFQLKNITKASIKTNGNNKPEDLNTVLAELYESECEIGFEDNMDIAVEYQSDLEADQIDNDLSNEIDRNLKNSFITREVPNEEISSSIKNSFFNFNVSEKLSLPNQESEDISVTIHQDMFKDFSGEFNDGINFVNTCNVEYSHADNKNNNTSNNQITNLKDTNSYMLSNNIQQEIQPRHNELLDNSFESSLNFTPRRYLPDPPTHEQFFNMDSDETDENLQILPQRSSKRKEESQFLSNVTN